MSRDVAVFLCNVIFEAKEVGEISEETRCLRTEKKKYALPLKLCIDKTDFEYVCVKIYAYGPDLEGNI